MYKKNIISKYDVKELKKIPIKNDNLIKFRIMNRSQIQESRSAIAGSESVFKCGYISFSLPLKYSLLKKKKSINLMKKKTKNKSYMG